MDINHNDRSDVLKELSVQDFLDVGLNQIAYIRCLETAEDNSAVSYAVHAADGSQISVMNSYDTAVAAIHINDLFPVTLH